MTLIDRALRYQIAFGVVAAAAGVAGFVHARDVAFTATNGAALGWGSYELTLMSYNRLGALVTLALGLVGLVTALARRLWLGGLAALGFGVVFALGIIQVRASGANVLGISPQTMAFSLALTLGFAVTAAIPALVRGHDAPVAREPTLPSKDPT